MINKIYGAGGLTGGFSSGGGCNRAEDWAAGCRRRGLSFGGNLAKVLADGELLNL